MGFIEKATQTYNSRIRHNRPSTDSHLNPHFYLPCLFKLYSSHLNLSRLSHSSFLSPFSVCLQGFHVLHMLFEISYCNLCDYILNFGIDCCTLILFILNEDRIPTSSQHVCSLFVWTRIDYHVLFYFYID